MYDSWGGGYGYFPRRATVAERRARAAREAAKRRKKGLPVDPVIVEGRTIATTFWGEAWCRNLERYSDYETRLPRGRSYVRSGSVLHLGVKPGRVEAIVSGTRTYTVEVKVGAVPPARWKALRKECVGSIASLVELLRGEFDKGVMDRVCREGTGLFPSPKEIHFKCSCLDWADMCKHVAAVLYGVGSRLDREPDVLFRLRGVSAADLVAGAAVDGVATATRRPAGKKVLAKGDVPAIFGIEMAAPSGGNLTPRPTKRRAAPAGDAARAPAPSGSAREKRNPQRRPRRYD